MTVQPKWYEAKCQDCNKDLGHVGDGEFFVWEDEPICDDCYGGVN